MRREEAGFPPGYPVFRVLGDERLAGGLESLEPVTLLVSRPEGETVCLVALRPDQVPSFRRRVLDLIDEGVIRRVEAEPQL
jgi:hypothetical protein